MCEMLLPVGVLSLNISLLFVNQRLNLRQTSQVKLFFFFPEKCIESELCSGCWGMSARSALLERK